MLIGCRLSGLTKRNPTRQSDIRLATVPVELRNMMQKKAQPMKRPSRVPCRLAHVFAWLTALLCLAAVSRNATCVAQAPAETRGDWRAKLTQRIAQHPGEAAVMVQFCESGERFAHRENETFPTASLIKLPVMIEAYRQAESGRISLRDMVTLHDADKVPGSGILTPHFSEGATLPLRDAIRLMIAWSDNTATNLVLDRVGLQAVNDAMADLGCPETRVQSKVYRRDTSIDLERSRRYGLGCTTAAEMIRLLEKLQRRELVGASASDEMRAHLAACQDKLLFPRKLPPRARVEHKTGGVTGVRTDAGLITGPGGTVLICVLTSNNRIAPGERDDPGELLCAEVAAIAYEELNFAQHAAPQAEDAETPPLRVGDSGAGVRRLQQWLNERRATETPIDLDGEFGPQTRTAVERFQATVKLPVTGVVDEETWKQLRPPAR
jgi:beta-lactamase class A